MQFTVSKTEFIAELAAAKRIVEKKSTIPILQNLLLKAEMGKLHILATDLDVSLRTSCNVDWGAGGAACVPAHKLHEIVGKFDSGEIKVELLNGDTNRLRMKCGRAKFDLAFLPEADFPEIAMPPDEMIAIPAQLLRTMIQRVEFAITKEESRYTLNGAKLEIKDGKMRMIATDGHRLAFIESELPGVELDDDDKVIELLIPAKALKELASLCGEDDSVLEFAAEKVGGTYQSIHARSGKRSMTSRLLTGQFPNYRQVLPDAINLKTFITVEAIPLANSIRRMLTVADERSHAIQLELGDEGIKVNIPANDQGSAEDFVPAIYEGPEVKFAVNADYLLDALNVMPTKELLLELKDGQSQVQLRPKFADDAKVLNYRVIVMPMKL